MRKMEDSITFFSGTAIRRLVSLAILLVVFSFSCSEDTTQPDNGDEPAIKTRLIADVDYASHVFFFLDNPVALGVDSSLRPRAGLIDVYRSVEDWEINSQLLITTFGAAFVDSLGDGSEIGGGGLSEPRQFVLLEPGEDYDLVFDAISDDVNGIGLARPLASHEVLAVAYVNLKGDTIGDYGKPFSKDEGNPLSIELIWPANARPDGPFGYTWAYMMRNIYNLGATDLDLTTVTLNINEIANRDGTWHPDSSSIPWIRIFGLDLTDATGTGPPDGKLDLDRGIIDPQRGLLTFPCLTPFDPNPLLVEQWTDGEFAFTGEYAHLLNLELYTEPPGSSKIESKFVIEFKFSPRQTFPSWTICPRGPAGRDPEN